MSIIVFLITALALGMRHALDPDHLVAVSTLVAEERRLWPAARLGLNWGVGHLLPIALLGIPVLLLRLKLPEAMENVVDLGVGLLLVVLGVRTLWLLHRERFHSHVHAHIRQVHSHFHAHGNGTGESHTHHDVHPRSLDRRGQITFVTGMVHGLAGSGAAVVLALTAAPSVATGVGYLLVFGLGTCIGMFTTTLCIAAPVLFAQSRVASLRTVVRVVAGLASMVLGILMCYKILPELLT